MNRFITVFLLLVSINSARAAETQVPLSHVDFSPSASALNVVTGLVVVLLCMWGVVWLMRRWQNGGLAGRKDWRVIAALHLGQKERLLLVQVGDEQFLLGVTANGINQLARYAEPVLKEDMFANKLSQALTKYQKERK
ncbi:flagellar biosynthetic protein FliO [Pokkaliibacter sp. MBI-7]|uniref:flagellar biosynthetic protein FliO n=1 Tax=Pokkaliibacter sp. MBI-7 TaxID=3040600 RepID=UPI0024470698|nr:flagellar biosynthetic protein FliO [Pokkaliibacter sp. MBI-7]MDH2431255.1 flagellar biosynthetic protein FliO [Pokkaliibacter sp. MBI-7]